MCSNYMNLHRVSHVSVTSMLTNANSNSNANTDLGQP